ncbi:hypothetical protein HUJ05_011606, partial [Dendroctonus ponderosae]
MSRIPLLEEHNEDPFLLKMRLTGDGVFESLLHGELVGITSRKSRSSSMLRQKNRQLLQNREIRSSTGISNRCSNVSRRLRESKLPVQELGNSTDPAHK